MSDAAAVNRGHANVVDQLLGDECSGVPDSVEDFADRERRGGVLANDAKAFLELGGDGVFEPEEVIGLEAFAEACSFDRREAMVGIVEKMNVIAIFNSKRFKELRNMEKIFIGGTYMLRWQPFF